MYFYARRIMAVYVAGLLMMLGTAIEALQLVVSDISVHQGGSGVLACSATGTKDRLTQITWQRQTRSHPLNSDFVTITPEHGVTVTNGDGDRVKFIGNFDDKNGSLELSSVTLMDEGSYTCGFTFFSSGTSDKQMALNVVVPPVSSIVDDHPVWGGDEVSLATCKAAVAKPAASVSWLVGDVPGGFRTLNRSIQNDKGTVTTISSLVGVPSRELNNQLVQCFITSSAFEGQTLSFNMQIYFPPTEVNIRQLTDESFKCEAEANPAATFVWTRTDGWWPQSSATADGATLKFGTMSSSLNGRYQCEASNQYGSKSSLLYIYVPPGHCPDCWTWFGPLLSFVVVMWLISVGPPTS